MRANTVFAAVLLLTCSVGRARAATLFFEPFEYAAGDVQSSGDTCVNQTCTNMKSRGWEIVRANCNGYCSMSIVPAPFGRAGTVLRYDYKSDQDLEPVPAQDAHNANLIKLFNPTVYDLWGRVFFATDVDNTLVTGATASRWFCCNTKLHYIKPSGAAPSYVTGYASGEFIPAPVPLGGKPSIGVQEAAVCPSGGTPIFKGGNGCNNMPQSSASVTILDKQWYCMEYHIKLNSAHTASDGAIEMWIDGTQVQNYQNQRLVDGFYTLANAGIGSIEVYRQHSNHMYRYEDDLVWATTRIGCGTTPPPVNTMPPGRPTGLRLL